jgi:predicted dehydrogenase
MKEVNWGLIGCGQVTEVKSGPGLYKSEHSNLVAVYDNTYERAVDYGRRHNVSNVYSSAEELLQDPNIDIVYIATPPKFHKYYAMKCLEYNKIPYVEKPLAMNYEECLAIKKKSEEVNIPVYVAFYRRGMEKFLKIKELLDQKTIGEIRYVYLTQIMKPEEAELQKSSLPWRVIPEISGGGKFLDMGVHVFDCLELFFGKMLCMNGLVENKGELYEAEDTVLATFKFENGIIGSGNWCYVADHNHNEVQIVGEHGRIVYDGLDSTQFRLIKQDLEEVFEFQEPEHVAMPYQQAVVNELIGKEKSHANFDEAMNLVKMTDMLLDDYYKGATNNVKN